MTEYYRQFAFVTSVLGGFAFALFGTLLLAPSSRAALLLADISVEPAGVGVPDGGSTVSLLGCALVGLAALRLKLGY